LLYFSTRKIPLIESLFVLKPNLFCPFILATRGCHLTSLRQAQRSVFGKESFHLLEKVKSGVLKETMDKELFCSAKTLSWDSCHCHVI
jgi:hypothetical protein